MPLDTHAITWKIPKQQSPLPPNLGPNRLFTELVPFQHTRWILRIDLSNKRKVARISFPTATRRACGFFVWRYS